jgi:serine/threonine protein kinase
MVLYPQNLEKCLETSLLSYEARIEIMRQASIGLANFQAALQRIYVDFKPANILIERKEDGSLHAVLGDLGGSGEVGKHNVGTGTPLYASPERFQAMSGKGVFGYSHDAWSFGATLLEVTSGILLETENLRQINRGNLQCLDDWKVEVNALTRTLPADKIGNLIRKCLYSESWMRPQVSEL